MRLKVAHKLLISGVALLLPFLVLLHSVVVGIDAPMLRASLLSLSLTSAVFGAGLLLTTARGLNDTLVRVIDAVDEIKAGRLHEAELCVAGPGRWNRHAARQAGKDVSELLTSCYAMVRGFSAPLKQLQQSGFEVSGSSIDVAASVKQLEATVVEQASSTNEVTATSKEIFATVQKLAGTMHTVQQMASQAAALASAGIDRLNGINSTMSELVAATAGISSLLTAISDKAATITQVITAITNIANRTNLISLNAAIEAEKAGEHASGFSVVAVEIRRLADQTAVAALDIEKMIGEMQAAVKDGVASMSQYALRARASSDTVAGITTDLTTVIEYTRQLAPHFEAVNSGMQMQSRAAGQILEAMQQLATTAGQTRDSLLQFREVADRMRSSVQVLQSEVEHFSVSA